MKIQRYTMYSLRALLLTVFVGGIGCSVESTRETGAGGSIGIAVDGDVLSPVMVPKYATPCVKPSDCPSGHCVDGVCCNSACTSLCQACTAARKGSGTDGTCGNIGAGLDPDNECPGTCSGFGSCSKGAILLGLGADCSTGAECASGWCVDGVCCDSSCSGTCRACTAALKGSGSDGTCGNIAAATDPENECAASDCNGVGACGLPPGQSPNGAPCSLGNTCLSGFCVDAMCCNSACTGSCTACSAIKKAGGTNGTCGPIAAGADPDNECTLGSCNGAGACAALFGLDNGASCVNGGACQSGFCVKGVCCMQSSCTPSDSCHIGICPLGTGMCTNIPRTCPGGGTCSNGICSGQCTGTVGLSGLPLIRTTRTPDLVAMGDVDGDGDPDLVVATNMFVQLTGVIGYINALRNNGDGTFTAAGGTNGLRASALIMADMNNDGYPDAIEAGETPQNQSRLQVKFSNGSGGFVWGPDLNSTAGRLNKLVAADLNHDGYQDLVVRAHPSGRLYTTLNNGATTLAALVDLSLSGIADFHAADLNGDGNADLVVANSTTSVVGVRFGNGNGTFGTQTDYPAVNGVNAIGLGDLDTDGDMDVVASNGTSTHVRLNSGTGVLAAPVTYPGGSGAITDLNGDGHLDVLGSTTLFNNGNGTFAPQSMEYVPYEGSSFGDLDKDGLMDMARIEGLGIHVVYNQGNGAFQRPYVPLNLGVTDYRKVVSADLNADNLDDLALVSASNTVGVRINTGNGVYAPQVDYPTGAGAIAIAAADMNADGVIDLVTAGSATMSVLLNNGGGTFAAAANTAVAQPSPNIAVADFNGDGYADVARTTTTTTLKVMFNNGNGTLAPSIDVAPSVYEPAALGAADLNGDGHIDVVSLSRWGLGEVFINDGNGGFAPPVEYLLVGYPTAHGLVIADLNGDGYKDLAATADAEDSMYVIINFNIGDGTFGYATSVMTNDYVHHVAATDVDGNGFNDLIVSLGGGTLQLHLNNGNGTFAPELRYPTIGPEFIATDVNGDGLSELLTPKGALHRLVCNP